MSKAIPITNYSPSYEDIAIFRKEEANEDANCRASKWVLILLLDESNIPSSSSLICVVFNFFNSQSCIIRK